MKFDINNVFLEKIHSEDNKIDALGRYDNEILLRYEDILINLAVYKWSEHGLYQLKKESKEMVMDKFKENARHIIKKFNHDMKLLWGFSTGWYNLKLHLNNIIIFSMLIQASQIISKWYNKHFNKYL